MLNLGQSEFLKNSNHKIRKTVVKIPSAIEYIKKASSKILKAVEPCNAPEDKIFDIRLCVEEAVRNAIVHGNRSDKKLLVRIAFLIRDDKLIMEVEDEGKGFDYEKLADPTEGDNILKNSGRGVFLIRRLMDEVVFNESGNKIRMVKYL